MARGGNFSFDINFQEVVKNLEVSISRVERGTKKATIAACEEIKQESLVQVPRQTETLANSFFYEIDGAYRNFTATMGYGGNGDPVNPRTGQRASDYMVKVHEDLSVPHPYGKAKFLEDPVNAYRDKFLPGMARALAAELGG